MIGRRSKNSTAAISNSFSQRRAVTNRAPPIYLASTGAHSTVILIRQALKLPMKIKMKTPIFPQRIDACESLHITTHAHGADSTCQYVGGRACYVVRALYQRRFAEHAFSPSRDAAAAGRHHHRGDRRSESSAHRQLAMAAFCNGGSDR